MRTLILVIGCFVLTLIALSAFTSRENAETITPACRSWNGYVKKMTGDLVFFKTASAADLESSSRADGYILSNVPEEMANTLRTGDYVEVSFTWIMESYPPQLSLCSINLLENPKIR